MFLQKLMPREEFILNTQLRTEEIRQILIQNTGPPTLKGFFKKENKMFYGKIDNTRFQINRSAGNIPIEIVDGEIIGNQIKMIITLHKSTKTIFIFLLGAYALGMVGAYWIYSSVELVNLRNQLMASMGKGFLFLCIFILIFSLGRFKIRSRAFKEEMKKLFSNSVLSD